jgi:hypothetical protein
MEYIKKQLNCESKNIQKQLNEFLINSESYDPEERKILREYFLSVI